MVGLHFCKALIKRGLEQKFVIEVVGEESVPAYDRIHLSSYVETKDITDLIFESESWYKENGIALTLGDRVVKINKGDKNVETSSGKVIGYDYLVLATGSRAFSPEIEGIDNNQVILYRTIEDIKKIVEKAEGKKHATIIGGGLLGLEAAQAVQGLGLDPAIVHIGGHLMSSQLIPQASRVLQQRVEEQKIEVFLSANTKKISDSNSRLQVDFADGRGVETDFVIVSAGIRPNSEIAVDAEISCGVRGGVIVNRHMETTSDNIFAIGECALFEGQIFGLAAPGYAMADHLAARMAGEKVEPMETPDMSTQLKMIGVDVVTVGDPLQDGTLIEFDGGNIYRAITIGRDDEIKGALGIGAWEESARVQSLYLENAKITNKEKDYFVKEGVLSEGGENSVQQWPDSRVICNCMGITKGEIIGCFKTCGQDPDKIAAQTSCSEVCGSCRPLLEELCNKPPSKLIKPVAVKRLLTLSVFTVLAVAAILILPPAPISESVESWYYNVDKLWRNNVTKQITGYVLMAIFVFGMLISLRKRFRWFRFGNFNKWRVFHAFFGVASLGALFFHTGFHFGSNLNYWLMLCFVLINVLGGVAGVFSAIESSGTSELALKARRFRPALVYLHVILFWPLPILLAFHIASVYLY